MNSLEKSVEQLYRSLDGQRKPRAIDGCPCCVNKDDLCKLLSKDRETLNAGDLERYAFKAITTIGTSEDYLYFLPRILELYAADPRSLPDIEVTYGKIAECEPQQWPEERQTALRNYTANVVESLVQSETFELLDSWLCASGRAGLPISPLLKIIEANPKATFEVYSHNEEASTKKKLGNAFWEKHFNGYQELVEWLCSDLVFQTVCNIYEKMDY